MKTVTVRNETDTKEQDEMAEQTFWTLSKVEAKLAERGVTWKMMDDMDEEDLGAIIIEIIGDGKAAGDLPRDAEGYINADHVGLMVWEKQKELLDEQVYYGKAGN